MARVIKGKADSPQPSRVVLAKPKEVEGGKVIDRDMYRASMLVKQIEKDGELKRKQIIAQGIKQVELAKEEAVLSGASEAISAAAKRAIEIFKNKEKLFTGIQKDMHVLVTEIVKKVISAKPSIENKQYDELINEGLVQLRSHRKVTIEMPTGKGKGSSSFEKKVLAKLSKRSDFVVSEKENVPKGFARIVTDVGSALCPLEETFKTLDTI